MGDKDTGLQTDINVQTMAEELLELVYDEMDEGERRVLERIAKRHAVSRDLVETWTKEATFGQRVADRVAAFGGSWTFIIFFALVIIGWVLINTVFIVHDPVPYPFILLNLLLSMLAAFQAPVIMMSQNRQAQKDRQAAANDYEVNLKAELEILRLHEKIDALRDRHLQSIIQRLEAKIDESLAKSNSAGGTG